MIRHQFLADVNRPTV